MAQLIAELRLKQRISAVHWDRRTGARVFHLVFVAFEVKLVFNVARFRLCQRVLLLFWCKNVCGPPTQPCQRTELRNQTGVGKIFLEENCMAGRCS